MTACINRYEDRFLENIDRRIGARTSGSSTLVLNYRGATPLNVWRRSDAQVEAPMATHAPRPVAPVVKRVLNGGNVVKAPAPAAVKVVETQSARETWEAEMVEMGRRTMEVAEARRVEEDELAEAERYKERIEADYLARFNARQEARLQKEKERQRRLRDAEKAAERERQSEAAKRLRNSRDYRTGAVRGLQPLTPAEQQVVDAAELAVRIAELAYDAIFEVYDDKGNGLKWRFDSKKQLLDAAKNPAGVKHVAAFVTACEEIANRYKAAK